MMLVMLRKGSNCLRQLRPVKQYALSVANGPRFGCDSTGRTDCHQRGVVGMASRCDS